jgi:O-antigen ligase/polysaccharide polymerase Wzy-like membrane protein
LSTDAVARWALAALVVGLALHNAAMAQLWDLGVRGTSLDVVAAWKEAVLLVALVAVVWKARRLPLTSAADLLAFAYAGIVILYAVLPHGWLDSEATARGELLALRHHLLPVAAYVLGRLLSRWWRPERLGIVVAVTAAGVAVIGLLDLALISLQAWRDSGVPGWYREQLDLDYKGLSGLPENWVYNTGDETNPIRRLVSTFLSPLASAYAFVVALLYVLSRHFRWWWGLLAVLLYAGLLYTHTRAGIAALAVGLVALALVQRRWAPIVLAVASLAVAAAFFVTYPDIGPSTSYTPQELEILRENAEGEPGVSTDPFSTDESSLASHWRNLQDGVEAVVENPQGYGLGNAGVTAKRTGVDIKAGESTYLELGVDTGVAGLAAFVLWGLALLLALWRRRSWVVAVFAAVLALGLQTDIIGVHWIAVVVWALAGLALGPRHEPETATIEPNQRLDGTVAGV